MRYRCVGPYLEEGIVGDVGWPIPQGIGDVMGDSLDAAGAEALRPAQVRPFAGYACWASMLITS